MDPISGENLINVSSAKEMFNATLENLPVDLAIFSAAVGDYKVKNKEKDKIKKKESIDFVLMHPPYADIVKYSDWKIKEDLSNIHDIDKFCDEIEKVAKESFRVLKPWKYCAVLMWDTRREKMYQPLAFKVMERFLKVWFALKEDIIKSEIEKISLKRIASTNEIANVILFLASEKSSYINGQNMIVDGGYLWR